MILYYIWFFMFVLLFFFGEQRHGRVWYVLSFSQGATILSINLIYLIGIENVPEQILIRCSIEAFTILALRHHCDNTLAKIQATLLGIAFFFHYKLFQELKNDSYYIYSYYGRILTIIGILQLTAGHESITSICTKLVSRFKSVFRKHTLAHGCLWGLHRLDAVELVEGAEKQVYEKGDKINQKKRR